MTNRRFNDRYSSNFKIILHACKNANKTLSNKNWNWKWIGVWKEKPTVLQITQRSKNIIVNIIKKSLKPPHNATRQSSRIIGTNETRF